MGKRADSKPKKTSPDIWAIVRVLPLWSSAELERLAAQVAYQLDRARAFEEAKRASEIVSTRTVQERVKCGKPGCKCSTGDLHGPYWYAIETFADGRTRKRYLGKEIKTR